MTDKQRRQAAAAEVRSARDDLAQHLNQLEDAINLPKRAARWVGRTAGKARRFAEDRPGTAATTAAVALGVVGAAIALIIRANRD